MGNIVFWVNRPQISAGFFAYQSIDYLLQSINKIQCKYLFFLNVYDPTSTSSIAILSNSNLLFHLALLIPSFKSPRRSIVSIGYLNILVPRFLFHIFSTFPRIANSSHSACISLWRYYTNDCGVWDACKWCLWDFVLNKKMVFVLPSAV